MGCCFLDVVVLGDVVLGVGLGFLFVVGDIADNPEASIGSSKLFELSVEIKNPKA